MPTTGRKMWLSNATRRRCATKSREQSACSTIRGTAVDRAVTTNGFRTQRIRWTGQTTQRVTVKSARKLRRALGALLARAQRITKVLFLVRSLPLTLWYSIKGYARADVVAFRTSNSARCIVGMRRSGRLAPLLEPHSRRWSGRSDLRCLHRLGHAIEHCQSVASAEC
jgi:hypothetical protein